MDTILRARVVVLKKILNTEGAESAERSEKRGEEGVGMGKALDLGWWVKFLGDFVGFFWTVVHIWGMKTLGLLQGCGWRLGIAGAAVVCTAEVVHAQVDPLTGIEMVRIGAVNNIGYNREDPTGRVAGRGSVSYEYNIGRTEVPTSTWLEFYNALYARADAVPIPVTLVPPFRWGGEVDPNYQGPGTRYRLRSDLPDAAMTPVGGIDWRTCAILCNWLHNEKSTAASAFMNGAYDVSTFSPVTFPTWTDQLAHHPGARYWIPTWDEWLKAAHFDQNKVNGDGSIGGWWLQPNATDVPLTYGLPASMGGSPLNQANAGFQTAQQVEFTVPLKAYLGVQSPWGLWDVAGGTWEWLETPVFSLGVPSNRYAEGSWWGNLGPTTIDLAYGAGSDYPNAAGTGHGLRIASLVPCPATLPCAAALMLAGFTRSRRHSLCRQR